MSIPPSSASPSPSRKRKIQEANGDEIEVDINAPEPPSKKALRKARKNKSASADITIKTGVTASAWEAEIDLKSADDTPKRSDYGIWIGNLPWSVTKPDLRTLLTSNTNITETMITRVHMPAPKENSTASHVKPQNKGFAYVDFSSQAALDEALALSETMLTGRRVLIKDSKSFEGRPKKPKESSDPVTAKAAAPPSKRIFIGNLDFDTTKEDIQDHFARCGEVLDVHLATFQDSGKCKGYGWVEFDTVEAGQAAVRGWVDLEQSKEQSENEDEEEELTGRSRSSKKHKLRKWWVYKIKGRQLRMEFAESKEVRYKKRYDKKAASQEQAPVIVDEEAPVDRVPHGERSREYPEKASRGTELIMPTSNSKKHDARKIKPGAALAAAPRLSGSIMASQGKKTVLA